MKKQKQEARKEKNRKRYIGVDLHTNIFTACFFMEEAEHEIVTLQLQGGGLEQFIKMLQPEDELAVEATGNSTWFREQVVGHVARVVVVAPTHFDVILRSVKKTDKNDARALATFLKNGLLPEARVKSKQHAQLTSAIRTRDRLVKQGVSHRNHVTGMCNGHGIKLKKKSLNSKVGFDRVLNSCEWSNLERAELEAISDQLEVIREHVKRMEAIIVGVAKTLPGFENLISIKGIGALSAAVLLTTVGDIKDFRRPGHLAAYFGITPRVSQSNDSRRVGRITKHGSKIARSTLVQCTLVAIRYSPYLRSFYNRLKSKRGSGKAIIATARKLLNAVFYTLKHGWVFEDFPNFELKACN